MHGFYVCPYLTLYTENILFIGYYFVTVMRVFCGNFSRGFFSSPCIKRGADSGSRSGFGSNEHQHRPTKKKEKKTAPKSGSEFTKMHESGSGIRNFLYIGLYEIKKIPENSTVFLQKSKKMCGKYRWMFWAGPLLFADECSPFGVLRYHHSHVVVSTAS